MVHIIPLFADQRRPDAGDAAPGAAPAGPLDPYWQEVADHYERRMAQQRAFDTEIAARRLEGEIAGAEADTVADAPADGAGLHHAMYGEVAYRARRAQRPVRHAVRQFPEAAAARAAPGSRQPQGGAARGRLHAHGDAAAPATQPV